MNSTAIRALLAGVMALGLAACADQMDMNRFGGQQSAPQADARGVITYPTYQVAVAQPGDTVRLIAERLGQDPDAMAKLNGIHPDAALRTGEVVVLPAKIESYYGPNGQPLSNPGGPDIGSNVGVDAQGAPAGSNAAPVRKPGSVDIAAIANDAINKADNGAAPPKANEPLRHTVQQGETAEGIAARYGVSMSALTRLNHLRPGTSLRLGQILLIPTEVTAGPPRTRPAAGVTPPGVQSPVAPPPSASTPLPKAAPAAAAPAAAKPEPAPAAKPSDTQGKFTMPVKGSVIRDFQKGKSDGIDISAKSGSPVVAAGDGTVAAITRDTKGVPILVIRHSNGLLTVYAGIDNLTVKRGDAVSRGQKIAEVRRGSPPFLHFEVRKGIESIDPMNFL